MIEIFPTEAFHQKFRTFRRESDIFRCSVFSVHYLPHPLPGTFRSKEINFCKKVPTAFFLSWATPTFRSVVFVADVVVVFVANVVNVFVVVVFVANVVNVFVVVVVVVDVVIVVVVVCFS